MPERIEIVNRPPQAAAVARADRVRELVSWIVTLAFGTLMAAALCSVRGWA